jgi:glycerophosphoryl diester phosphodiesterase
LHLVFGHRGNAANAPENTLESIRQAVALGVDGVEFDVRLSADGQLVLMHDPTVDRTTNGTGAVRNLTLRQLRTFDAGYNYGPPDYPYRGKGLTIPTAQKALEITAPLELIIEIKAVEASQPLLDLLTSRGDKDRVTVGSFIAEALIPFRRAGFRTTASLPEARALLAPAVCRIRRANLPFTMLSIPPRYRGVPLPVSALARCVAEANVSVSVWTVNDARLAVRLWRGGVAGIISDDPQRILDARRALG